MTKAVFRAAWAMTGLAILTSLLHLFEITASANETLYLIAAVQVFVAAIVGITVNKPDRRVSTTLLVLVAVLIAAQLFDNRNSDTYIGQIVSESLFLLVQLILVIGIFFTVQRRFGPDPINVVFDSLIIGLGSWFLIWLVFLNTAREASQDVLAVTAIRGVTLASSAVVIFLLASLLLGDSQRTPALWLAAIAIGCTLVGDFFYATNQSGRLNIADRVVNAPYIASLFLVSATILHPSVSLLALQSAPRNRRPLLGRLVLTTSALVVPVLALALTNPTNESDRTVRAISIFVLAMVFTLRIIFAVRENTALQNRLVTSAQTDSLTNLPNRGLMIEHVTSSIENARLSGNWPTVLFIDVDRFKNINDSLGHSAGDDVLISVAQRLRVALPDRCIVGRISGDEFVVLDAKSKSQSDAVILADQVLESFHEPLSLRQGDVFVSASIGVAIFDEEISSTADDLLRHADTAMYRAKDAGRNCVAIFDKSMLERVNQRLAVETALYRALERRELRLVHQPIIDIDLGDVIGFEALMRWDMEDGSNVSPAEFIPIAEETGTIVPIGSWALLEALTHLRGWINQGICRRDATMSVNVSPRQLHDPNFAGVVNEALRRSRVPAEQLWLEVTEGVMITQPDQALDTLRRLSAIGVRVAIDDFGTGYSSLSFLQKFPIHRLKIDRSFVNELANNANARSLVKTIIAMADSLGLDVVAEGVETVEQLHALGDLRCSKAQGYLISHPVTPEMMASTVAGLDKIGKWPRLRPLK